MTSLYYPSVRRITQNVVFIKLPKKIHEFSCAIFYTAFGLGGGLRSPNALVVLEETIDIHDLNNVV